MKRLLAGCVVGLVVGAIAAAAGAYFLWRAAAPVVDRVGERVSGATEGLRRLGGVSEIERGLANTDPFTPPASGELTEAQLERFLRVQTAVEAALGARAEAFTAKYREMSRTLPDGTTAIPTLQQVVAGLSELSTVYLDARRAQVAAMNAEGFSRDEFSWVRARVYQAAGLDAIRYDARDLERAIAALAEGVQLSPPDVRLPDAPARNKELVKPHTARIARWIGLAVFGL
jgi:hypothetical protein